VNDFSDLCRARHLAGLERYRAGDASRPFEGDPLEEGIQETVDLANYADAAEARGLLGPEAAESVRDLARAAYAVLRRALEDPGHG